MSRFHLLPDDMATPVKSQGPLHQLISLAFSAQLAKGQKVTILDFSTNELRKILDPKNDICDANRLCI